MTTILHQLLYKLTAIIVAVTTFFGANLSLLEADKTQWQTNYTYVFVHGLSGWGSYDSTYKIMPYWGMFGGDLMKYLGDKGFNAYAASVDPNGSAWDRACELYAQLTGTRVDYGKAHSERCRHERYGEDFTGRALIPSFSAEDKINLLGHSFGGATTRLFANIMEKGSAEEIAATPADELSDYFKGGKGDWIYSITSLAAPHNGTSAYHTGDNQVAEPAPSSVEEETNPVKDYFSNISNKIMSKFTGGERDDRISSDYADYDMNIDNALKLNETIITYKNTYYFSIACTATTENADGTHSPDTKIMESIYTGTSERMGKYTGVTKGGFIIDETWLENDGLVNTVSALAPSSAPSTQYVAGNVSKGIWNIMPIYHGDHMSLQGGMTKINDVKCLYVEHLSMINSLDR